MNVEEYEQAMDALFRTGLYDKAVDDRSEARYEETDADRQSETVEDARLTP